MLPRTAEVCLSLCHLRVLSLSLSLSLSLCHRPFDFGRASGATQHAGKWHHHWASQLHRMTSTTRAATRKSKTRKATANNKTKITKTKRRAKAGDNYVGVLRSPKAGKIRLPANLAPGVKKRQGPPTAATTYSCARSRNVLFCSLARRNVPGIYGTVPDITSYVRW